MKEVLITGGSGFLGKYLVREGIKRGYKVTVFDLNDPNIEEVSYIQGDVLNLESLTRAVEEKDYIFHLGAISDIDECLTNPTQAVAVNILGTLNLLEACKESAPERIILASSVYAGGTHGGIYSTTKKTSESLLKDYSRYYGLDYTILRYGTLYGVGAPKTNSIMRYLTEALKSGQVNYTGNGEEIREYIHVEDASELSFNVLDLDHTKESIVSLTGSNPVKTSDLFTMVKEILNGDLTINFNKKLTLGRTRTHYSVSPYSFERDKVHKLSKNLNRELGDALIEILHTLKDD